MKRRAMALHMERMSEVAKQGTHSKDPLGGILDDELVPANSRKDDIYDLNLLARIDVEVCYLYYWVMLHIDLYQAYND